MGINEMEFEWRLNWWYRPTQLDGFESSVVDYYDCFIDWKANMELNLCPADEGDYVAAFIQNLRGDIRSRLESKGRPSTRRLSNAFYDAKLEESLISIDEAFKKIKAKFEAHKLFDELPSQVSVVDTADSCSNKLAKDLSDDEFSGLEDDESSFIERGSSISEILSIQIDSEMEVHKMPDNLPEQNLEESPSIGQVLEDDEYDLATADETSVEKNGVVDIYKSVKSEEKGDCDKEIISSIADRKVFGGMSRPVFIATAGYKLVEKILDVDDWLNSQAETLKLMGKSTNPVFAGSKSLAGRFCSISTIEKVRLSSLIARVQLMETDEGSFSTKQTDLKIVYKVFDEMPQQTFLCPYEELNGNKGSTPLIHYVPFDPGDGVENVAPVGWRFDEMSKTFSLKIDYVSTRLHTVNITLNQISLEQPKGNGKAIMTVFDPGGILVCYKGCDPFEHTKYCQSCKCNVHQNDYGIWFDKLHVELVYKQDMIVIAVTLLVLHVIEGNESHISRKDGTCRVFSRDCYGAIELSVKRGIYNIEVDQVSAEQNLDMGSYLLPGESDVKMKVLFVTFIHLIANVAAKGEMSPEMGPHSSKDRVVVTYSHHLLDGCPKYLLGRVLQGCELLGSELGQHHLVLMRCIKDDQLLLDKIHELITGKKTVDSSLASLRLDDNLWVDAMLIVIFDPGWGISSHLMAWNWWILFPNDENETPFGMPIHLVPFEYFGKPLLAIEHLFYALLGSNTFYYPNAVLHKISHKHILLPRASRFRPSQAWARQCSNIEPLIVGLHCGKIICSVLASGTEMVWLHAKFHIQELRDIKGAPLVISIAHFSGKFWVAMLYLNRGGSSGENKIEDCKLNMISDVMYLLRPGTFELCLLFRELRFPKNGVLIVAIFLESFVWDPGLGQIYFSLSHMLC